ncbi:SDR family NAD(P)-dependent oxidoreductase [Azospira sp. I09]|uniref:SDR family NAD(P)-dependent oxidoreductase n=1 Tax=Azospira sp. I09 TaxID=1765049 RepID=UPI00126087AF|nr:SDR family NAD(P)-dependent oxidoreductase [Azospira sp. I09]BBN89225.1 short-chain dehydrogenase [Azospira sp. I09]
MLAQKIAVVTGAARGLGLAVAGLLAEQGCRVVLVGRREGPLQAACAELAGRGLAVAAQVADVTRGEDVARLAAFLEREYGGVDILVNNAGVFLEPHDFADPASGSLLRVDPALVAATLEANTLAPLRLMQALVPLMRRRGWGRIVNVSSGMGQLSTMGGAWPGYRASKTALNALTRILAAELAAEGAAIKVNAVCPGWCRTEMGGSGAQRSAEEGARSILWAATLPDDGPSGGFFRDGQPLDW